MNAGIVFTPFAAARCDVCVCVCVVRKAKVTDDVTFNTAATEPLQHTDSALPPSVCILMMPQLRVRVSRILMYHYITETHLFSMRNDSNCRWRTIEARIMSFELMKIQCLIKIKAPKNRPCLAAGTLRSRVWVVAVASWKAPIWKRRKRRETRPG